MKQLENLTRKESFAMEYRSQEGMEASLTEFAHILSTGAPGSFNSQLVPTFLRCNFKESTMVYTYEAGSWMGNPVGNIHGGIIAAMLDTTMGSLTYYMAGEKITPTITMKVDYVAPGKVGKRVYVGCKCTRCGRTMGYVTCKTWQDDEDKPFATADGVYFTAGPELKGNEAALAAAEAAEAEEG
jgi:uncharacterized protein (TIGR00369 family)